MFLRDIYAVRNVKATSCQLQSLKQSCDGLWCNLGAQALNHKSRNGKREEIEGHTATHDREPENAAGSDEAAMPPAPTNLQRGRICLERTSALAAR